MKKKIRNLIIRYPFLKIRKFKVIDEQSAILYAENKTYFLYEANYHFKEQNETNIPIKYIAKAYDKNNEQITNFLIGFKNECYETDLLTLTSQKIKLLKKINLIVYPIYLDSLSTVADPNNQKTESPFVHLHVHTSYSTLDGKIGRAHV